MYITEIFKSIQGEGTRAGLPCLAEQLLADGYMLTMETSGERLVGRLPKDVIKIVDVKCPGSGAPNSFVMRDLAAWTSKDEVKFVISSRRDYEFAREFVREAAAA
jgi:7-carboxy-7-deazaguanine synthase